MSHHDSKIDSTHYDAKHNPVGSSSTTHHDSKVHNPLSNDIVGNVPLSMTSHNQQDLQGPRPGTVAHTHQDTFEGHSGNVHETVTKKETIVEGTNRGLPQQVVQPVIVPVIQQVPIVQPVIQQQVHVQPAVHHDTTTVRTVIEPEVHRSVVEKATIVKETFLPEEKIEIQPVIHREREQTEVHKVVQPLHERDVMATKVVQATLADQVRSTVVESDAAFQARSREADSRFASTTEYAALKTQTVQKSAIIEEHIHKTIIEEVQPVLYKETVVPVIIQETQPIYEKIVEAPVVITEERAMRDLGTQFASSTVSDQRAFAHMGQGIIPPQSFVETTTTQVIREQIPGQQFVQGQHIPGQQYVQGQQFVGQQIPGQQYVQVQQIPGQPFIQGQQYVGQQIPGVVYDQQHHGLHGNQLAGTHHDQPHGQHGGLIGKIENALHGGSHSDPHHNQQFTNQQHH